MSKDFDAWNDVKKHLDVREILPSFQERQVWWCSIGMNVGLEVYGKGSDFVRPVLVMRKFSRTSFWGVPLTTKLSVRPYHLPIHFKGRDVQAQLQQLKLLDSRRLSNLMGYMPEEPFAQIVLALKNLLPKENAP